MEALQEALQQLVGVVNSLGVLAHNPNHGSPGLRLIQGVQVLTQCGDDTLIPKRRAHSQQVSSKGAQATQKRPSRHGERQEAAPQDPKRVVSNGI